MRRSLVPLLIMTSAVGILAVPCTAHAAIVAGVGSDTLTIIGDGADDRLTLRLAPDAPGKLLVDTGTSTSTFDRATFSRITIRTGGGADEIRVDEANGAFTDTEATTIESGAGNDVVVGGRGAEVIASGDDGDLILPGGGDDVLHLGAGNDTAVQGSDDGTDVFEGQSGSDTVQLSGSAESEEFTVQAVATRVRISRDVGSGRADLAGIERAEIAAGRGSDLIDVGDLSGTELARVDADLGLLDGTRDTVFAQGSTIKDTIVASAAGDSVRVTGLPSEVRVENANAADDRLVVQAGGGYDNVRALDSVGAVIGLTLEGNEGNDFLTGGSAVEMLRGGPDHDIIRGYGGADTVEGGDGDDYLIWSPLTEGSDTIGGDAGLDTLRIPTTTAADTYAIASEGPRVRILGATAQLNLDSAESISVGLGAGLDRLDVGDLTGTAIKTVTVDVGTADLKTDTVALQGTPSPDQVKAVAHPDHVDVTGLAARVILMGVEPGDRLEIDARDGDDTIDVKSMFKDKLQPFLTGGAGKDFLVGSPGQDMITGGLGDDVAYLGEGLDTFTWLPGDGDDIVEGGLGTDFLRASGTAADERFAVSPIGGRTRVTRDIDNVLLDLGGVERVDVNPAAGADSMQVDDLSGTSTKLVECELAPFRGTTATDGRADSVRVNGTFGNDAINVTSGGHQVYVSGLATAVAINRSDPTLDSLHIDTKPGVDIVTVAPGVHSLLKFSQS